MVAEPILFVATVPTVYGIETSCCGNEPRSSRIRVATVPTVYGIETWTRERFLFLLLLVATVPTVYGIET